MGFDDAISFDSFNDSNGSIGVYNDQLMEMLEDNDSAIEMPVLLSGFSSDDFGYSRRASSRRKHRRAVSKNVTVGQALLFVIELMLQLYFVYLFCKGTLWFHQTHDQSLFITVPLMVLSLYAGAHLASLFFKLLCRGFRWVFA